MLKINSKISSKKIIFYSYLLLSILIAAAFMATSLFLYNNFYQSLSQSAEVISLSQKVAFETVDVVKFKQLLSKLEKTSSSTTSLILNNPFD